MKSAIIAPVGLLRRYCYSDYHLCLAHLILENGKYHKYYQERVNGGDYVIMDNSMIELGYPMPPAQLQTAVEILLPNELVLSDFRRDPWRTYDWAVEWGPKFLDKWPEMKLMAVPHWQKKGDVGEWTRAHDQLSELEFVDVIGIPKFLGSLRSSILKDLDINRNRGKEYHLLGTTGNPVEVRQIAKEYSWVRGVDSKAPVRFAQHGIVFHPDNGVMLPKNFREVLPPMDFAYDEDPFPIIANHNVKVFRGWAEARETADVLSLHQSG